MDKRIQKKFGKILDLPIPVPVARPWDIWCNGESIRINPYGFPPSTAVARVEAFYFRPYLPALSFESPLPLLGPAHSFRLRTVKGQQVMILFRDYDFPAGYPNGPWVEISDQGHYGIETVQLLFVSDFWHEHRPHYYGEQVIPFTLGSGVDHGSL